MAPAAFNPFEDRLSRDIRNDLSESIAGVLDDQSLAGAEAVAQSYLKAAPAPPYVDYIHSRLDRYARALEQLGTDTPLLRQAAVLWDLQLFFEVHEILEPAWMIASGSRKLILQALIRAAGVYINLELGYRERAAKIGAKALPVLETFRTEIGAEIDIDELISAIRILAPAAPLIART